MVEDNPLLLFGASHLCKRETLLALLIDGYSKNFYPTEYIFCKAALFREDPIFS